MKEIDRERDNETEREKETEIERKIDRGKEPVRVGMYIREKKKRP